MSFKPMSIVRVLPWLCAAVAACADDPSPQPDAAKWLDVQSVLDDGTILVEKAWYRSGGLRIEGLVCRPKAEGRYPIFVMNHGGFEGFIDHDRGICQQAARAGKVAILSAYRGEESSEGAVEICLGEVDDVLAMIDVARAQPYAQRDKVSMFGISHGGCIAMRAMQRGAPVQRIVDFAGPTDWGSLYERWVADMEHASAELKPAYRALLDKVSTTFGGTPAQATEEYRRRSPLAYVNDLKRDGATFIMVQGNEDIVVPSSQTCALTTALGGVRAYHMDTQGRETTARPSACADANIAWLPEARPSTAWPAPLYLVHYDGAEHPIQKSAPMQRILDDIGRMVGVPIPPVP